MIKQGGPGDYILYKYRRDNNLTIDCLSMIGSILIYAFDNDNDNTSFMVVETINDWILSLFLETFN